MRSINLNLNHSSYPLFNFINNTPFNIETVPLESGFYFLQNRDDKTNKYDHILLSLAAETNPEVDAESMQLAKVFLIC